MKYEQSLCTSIGNYACYVFSLINLAEEYTGKTIDKFFAIEKIIENHYVKFNHTNYLDKGNFYVLDPCKILKFLTGKNWSVQKVHAPYKIKENEFAIEFWSKDKGETGHFCRTYKGYNSLQYSSNVENGELWSFRIFTVKE